MRNERTSKRVARIAGKILSMHSIYSPWWKNDRLQGHHKDKEDRIVSVSWKDIKTLAASALTQTADKAKRKTRRGQR